MEVTRVDGSLKINYRGPEVFVKFFGKLDHTLRNSIRPTLQPLLNQISDGAICIQMNDVFLLDTSTAAALIAFLRDAERSNVQFEIWGVSPVVMRVFKRLGAIELLNRP